MTTIDLFSGARGWEADEDCPVTDALGIELDPAAVATSRAAGFNTEPGDIAKLSPRSFGSVDGLIASPPCQTFSMAGNGNGRRDLDVVLGLIPFVAAGWPTADADDRTWLVLEPLRWAVELRPDWIALEQVPPVLPIWEAIAVELRKDGYHVETGLLHAEQYGVPQTRKRAVLIAARHRWISLPLPTHSRYYPRNPTKLDPDVLPWVSMAQALGWDENGDVISTGVNQRVRWDAEAHWRDTHKLQERPIDAPAPTVDGKAGSAWKRHPVGRRGDVVMRSNYGTGGDPSARGERTLDQPAPTVTGKIDRNLWQMASAGATARYTAGQVPRDLDLPAATITGKGTASWTPKELDGEHSAATSSRVTVEEAAILQSFPAGYPWQGTRTKQCQQVGNAIPPRLALACFRALGLDAQREAAA